MTWADLIVLGGGPAGVGAAYRAARAGHSVVVLERADRVGGAAGSFPVAGMPVDHGSHRLHPSVRPDILAELRSLLGEELQLRRRRGRIRLADRWIGFPLRAGELVRTLPWWFVLGAGVDALLSPLRRARGDTFAEAVRSGLGPTMGRHFYFPYARKLWGVDPEELSGEQVRRRISAATPWSLVRRVLSGGDGDRGRFLYPAGGYGRISERLAEGAVEAGVEVRLRSEVVSLREGPDEVEVRTADGRSVRGGRVFSTIPLTALARMVDPPPEGDASEAAGRLEFRSMVLAYLVADVPRYTPFDAHYLPDQATPITRISEPKNYRDSEADPPDRTVLCAEIPCRRDDEVWVAGADRLGELVVETTERLGLPPLRPVEVEVRRLSHAYPVYRVGFERWFEALDRWVGSRPRLLSFGRQGLFAHDNTHHALAMAWEAADALRAGGGFDEERWARAREGFRSHVVED